jgi:hypothetical protein
MQDSEKDKTPEALPIQVPPETSLVIVKTKEGGTREMLRSNNGKFVKKPKPLIPTVEFTRAERKLLNSVDQTKDGLTEYIRAFKNLIRIAQNEDSDPKAMMAAVKAFEVLRQSALGKFAPSELELDKLTSQPVKTIIVVSPELMHPQVVDEEKKKPEKKQPSFIDAVVVKQN